ncbi:amidohydrolase [Mailhella massiliensis]|uniref:Amidohydrolase family protein n=1 Tax=Mailhella massiliensis TaxID=1903261 RepID=A0A921AU02_9BACT|nr:amidohydrolase family protein [Mailhella massiliensis]HJD96098.1 amidohydrolase family protein [Mailhella massiliensis]
MTTRPLLPLLMLSLLCPEGQAAASVQDTVDTLYHNGVIRTMTDTSAEARNVKNASTAETLATRDGVIIFTGTEKEARARGYFRKALRVVDLRGKTLMPGFVDGHGHFPEQGQYDLYEINLNSAPLGDMASIADYQKALAARCSAAEPNQWILGWGYDDTSITDMRHPTREDIDTVCPGNPVYLRHISGHMGVANSLALEKAGLDKNAEALATEGVVKDGAGRPTGLLMETRAMGLVTSLPDFPKPDMQKSLARACHVYASRGVTTADQGASLMTVHLPLFQEGLRQGTLSLRVVLHPLAVYDIVTPEGIFDAAGGQNRKALGWKDGPDERSSLRFCDGEKAVPTGSDITRFGLGPDGSPTSPKQGLPEGRIFLGAWKILFDGSPQGYTAWLKAPGYYNWGSYSAADSFDGAPYFNGARGTLNLSPRRMGELIRLYHGAGQSTETHTNGNAAAEAWVAALERAVCAFPQREDTRHTSIHAQMLELQHIQRMTGNYRDLEGSSALYSGLKGAFEGGRLDPQAVGAPDMETLSRLMAKQHLCSSYFIDHVYFWGERHRNIFLGPGRADNMSPAGWSAYYLQPFSFHSDTFVTPIHPLRSVQTSLMRMSASTPLSPGGTLISGTGKDIRATVCLPARDPAQTKTVMMGSFPNFDQRINILQALLAVTRLPAWQNKLEGRFGSLQKGLAADFVILEQDPFIVAAEKPEKLSSIRVMATLVGDRLVYGFLPGSAVTASPPAPSYLGSRGPRLTMLSCQAVTQNSLPPLQKGERLLGAYAFRAEAKGGGTPLFQMDMLGTGGKVKEVRMAATAGRDERRAFAFSGGGALAPGEFHIAPLSDPTRLLGRDDPLQKGETYLVLFSPPDAEHEILTCSVMLTVKKTQS